MSETPEPRFAADLATSGTDEHGPSLSGLLDPSHVDPSRLDRLADLIRRQLQATTCQVALIDDDLRIVGGAGLPDGDHGATVPFEDTVCRLVHHSGAPISIGDTTADARTRTLDAVLSGQVGSYLGVPLAGSDGRLVGTLCVYDAVARQWTGDDEALLSALAGSVVAEIELAALTEQYEVDRALWDVAVAAGGIGTYDLHVPTGALRWDDRMVELFGYTRDEFEDLLSDAFNRIHPDDLPRVEQVVNRAVADCASYSDEYRVLLPDGTVRWIASRGTVLTGFDGAAERLIGAAYDVTAMREASGRLAATLDGMSVGYLWLDPNWVIAYVNERGAAILGLPPGELVGSTIWERFPATVGTVYERNYRHVAETGATVTFDAYYPAPLDSWFELRAVAEQGGVALYFLDITARVEAQQLAERDRARAELLSQLSGLLTGGAGLDDAIAALPDLVVPGLCDWCIVTVLDEPRRFDGPAHTAARLRDVGSRHADPDRDALLDRFTAARMAAFRELPEMPAMTLHAADTGEIAVRRGGATERTRDFLPPGASRSLLEELAPESVAVVPLRAGERTFALLTLGWDGPTGSLEQQTSRSRRGPSDNDLDTLTYVADRAAAALENARLSASRRELAEGLQRSLLTEPPDLPDLQIAVRYLPAAETAQVGGDWYDAFEQPDGATVVVIGDVLGHDAHAAAAMGQIRNLVRATQVITDQGPAEVLRTVDSAARRLRVGTFATAVVARVEPAPDGGLLRWSNAGHPPPIVISPDGTAGVLRSPRSNMLLGVDPAAPRDEHVRPLPTGSTVVMYTDGLVERRDRGIDEGVELLRAAAAELASAGLDELCDALIARLLPARPTDDVAVVAVRTR